MIRAGMLQAGCGTLGQLLAADPGYRGPRVPYGQGHEASGCKAVGQRLKLSGMRWTVAGADAITTLRCQQASRPEDQIRHTLRNQAPAA